MEEDLIYTKYKCTSTEGEFCYVRINKDVIKDFREWAIDFPGPYKIEILTKEEWNKQFD